ncbi:hypothetical protein MIND_00235500 [Mycena indigotica]|uniref:Nitrogen permease regulator 3 n=1 Tax=Mycena indigotica TaxID=2126181 RepID=A0A8H6T7A5_9AGAR|nr:uncharacterized protein MIND_00235500 [Mycena indigotica]KAF7312225.1 hypothetical protein MIND_00235500 [Mycena indigotica]
MAEFSNLLALLLVTTSAKGSSIVYRWPPSPVSSPRFSRAKPETLHPDNPWKSARPHDLQSTPLQYESDPEREWKRPSAFRDRSLSTSFSSSRSSGKNSPEQQQSSSLKDEDDHLLGYPSEFLANLLCPRRSMCHQKFELVVEDLAFIGHPVSAEDGGVWRFKPEKVKMNDRGRESRNRRAQAEHPDSRPASSEKVSPTSSASWLERFHFVMVLDVPDPSSSASGNITKYFDIIYEQIAFPVAAVLFQEQVLYNFVEEECERLGSLKDERSKEGDDFTAYMHQALTVSSIAPAMKTLFEALKSSSVAYVTIHNLPLELQLPPYLEALLHSEEDENEPVDSFDDNETQSWGQEMSFGYRLPTLTAWKSLLLLDDSPEGVDPFENLRQSLVDTGDRSLVESLLRFLELSSVTLSLADLASLLDWDLETQVFPTVRWLVHHRRAKIVDTVHPGLRTIFTLPAKFNYPLAQLTAEFDQEFSSQEVPSLPHLLAKISTSKERDLHFFASVVMDKDLIPLYSEVVIWMLKRDMIITLHLRVRIIATVELKEAARLAKGRVRDKKSGGRGGHSKLRNQLDTDGSLSPPGASWLSMSPKTARKYARAPSISGSRHSRLSELLLHDDSGESDEKRHDEESTDTQDEASEDEDEPSIINDPGQATPSQRRWLSVMSYGKDPTLVRHFERINQYFDGKRTDDEILYRAEMSRRELREVLHAYDEHLLTFLHPS